MIVNRLSHRFHRLLFLIATVISAFPLSADDRPNIVWIIADDLSPDLGCYDYPGIETPNIDALASDGARFSLAFATSPVCSPSRTAFQTGQYQTTLGGHHHNTRDKQALPPTAPTVTGLMRKAGYFVSNGTGTLPIPKRRAKSHMNFAYEDKTFFDGQDWSQRKDGQPFFAQIQIREPHRPFVKREHEYPDAPIPSHYPDHPITRADWGNYLASIEVLDRKVGQILARLESEGLADNTVVFFFGDHGRPHVRAKQWLYDGGIHVPLIVRWPGKIEPGRVDRRLTSLLDLMPSTLSAARVDLPSGTPLMGKNLFSKTAEGHDVIFAARDRCGEAVDRIRCVRGARFKYIRNFFPERAYLQHSSYKRLMYPVETLMRSLHANGQWTSPLMAKKRPAEEFYDLDADPSETNNLVADPNYSDQLVAYRDRLDRWIQETDDRGVIDESRTVDMKALREEKWSWFSKTMQKRGLDESTSDDDYLDWWSETLDIKKADIPIDLKGDWSLNVESGLPAWMRVAEIDGKPTVYLRLYVGSAGPYPATVVDDRLQFEIVKRQRKSNAVATTTKVDIGLKDGRLDGTLVRESADGSVKRDPFSGSRIPPMPTSPPDLSKVRFGHPISLFNGKDLTGWRVHENHKKNGWSVIDGHLVNSTTKTDFSATGDYANLRTEAEFDDFWLHIEFLVEEDRNSGIYLRGMYEAQVVDRDSRMQGIQGVGAIFGAIEPTVNAGRRGGEWQTYDLTLVDRHITVVLNGVKVIDNQPVDGPTAGAIYTNPSKPGPIYLQGDHTSVRFRNLYLAPAM